MFLFVDDRFSGPEVHEIERSILCSSDPNYAGMVFPDQGAVRVNVIDGDYHIIAPDAETGERILPGTEEGPLLELLRMDPDPVVLLATRRLFFQDPLKEIVETHMANGADVTVLVKDTAASQGMFPVYLDADLGITYDVKDDPVRTRMVDLNFHIISKRVLVSLLEKGGHIHDIDPRALSERSRMMGHKLRSPIGTITDLGSFLTVQRMAMDGNSRVMDEGTMSNLDIRDGQMLNMPLYLGKDITIGGQCRIGPYVSILGNVTIGDNVTMSNCIICKDSVIGDDSYLEGVIIGPGKHVIAGTEAEWTAIL